MARRKDVFKKIEQITTKYLLRNVGELAVTGWPRFDEDRQLWVVTVLCETPRGVVPAGRIELDKKLNLIYATPRDDMARTVEEQLRRLPHLVFAEEAELKAKGIDAITIWHPSSV
jgi:hypothetical protein